MAKFHHKKVLFFLSVLVFSTSCQKNHIPPTGHFTHYKFELKGGRSIASVAIEDFESSQNVDPKQVYISCALKNNTEKEVCFNESVKKLALEADFKSTEKSLSEITNKIIVELNPELIKNAKERNSFCEINSTLSFEKCLFQFFDKDTINITNTYQKDHHDLNGQEYLYIKKEIEKKYSQLLSNYLQINHQGEIKKINETVQKKFSLIEKTLLKNTEWIKGQKFLPNCHNYCVSFASTELSPFVSKFYKESLKKNQVLEEKCSDLLSHEKIMNEINQNTNLAIEVEVSKLSKKIGKSTSEKSIECFREKRIYDSEIQAKKSLDECIHKAYTEESKLVFQKWLDGQDRGSFFEKNSKLIMATVKVPTPTLKREIASKLENANP